ncbi:MAG TPA: hypothetical protein DIU39_03225 [Flavobacteriales bacterium]|nr:hypothetical protein [Flavobacteriales bacterium]|tara:strand:- start:38660 stop:39364 length:705 start_codon:yes stop_codon:yes gene_type:complete
MSQYFRYSFIILITALLFACGKSYSPEDKSEGKIIYHVEYPDVSDDHFMKSFLPDEMEMVFQGKKTMNSLKAGMGTFKSDMVCNLEDSTMGQYVKVFTKKYKLLVNGKDILPMIQREMPDYTIEKTGVTKYIADLPAEEVILHFTEDSIPDMTFYYTSEIKIENPNWCTPFYKVPGVLLQYEYTKYGMRMVFTAQKIEFRKIDDEIFTDFKGYKELTQDEMDEQMNEIFESFNY